MSRSFEELMNRLSSCEKKVLSVACAQDEPVLEAVKEAHEKGIVDAILVGREDEIKNNGTRIGMNLAD